MDSLEVYIFLDLGIFLVILVVVNSNGCLVDIFVMIVDVFFRVMVEFEVVFFDFCGVLVDIELINFI